jgi:gliding motility-associated-like protein
MKKGIILICIYCLLGHTAAAQTFYNNGATVAVTNGGVMSVIIDPTIAGSGSLENNGSTALLRNAGLILVTGSFLNTAGVADGFGTNTGEYLVQGDWNNNATFTADSSTVNLYGSSPQLITGNTTTFYNLTDSNFGTKTQDNGTNVNVAGTFTMYYVEHATAGNLLTILNPSPTAIVENSANGNFGINTDLVSSTGNGRLVWYTNPGDVYVFPTGITEGGSPKIREVSITPSSTPTSSPRVYSVRMADDPGSSNTTSQDGYDTAQKVGYISEVNDVYYHLISANGNTDPATLAIFYQPGTDPAWQSIGRWQVVPQWQDLQSSVAVPDTRTGATRIKVTKSAFIPTTDTAFALVDTIAVKTPFNFPTAFVADGQGIAQENTVFTIINQANLVTLQQLSVFDRWGEMVFDSKREGTLAWNGHFNGKKAQEGNYVYRAVVIDNNTGKQYPLVTGNVSLLW